MKTKTTITREFRSGPFQGIVTKDAHGKLDQIYIIAQNGNCIYIKRSSQSNKIYNLLALLKEMEESIR